MECVIPTKIEYAHCEGQKVFHSRYLKYADVDLPIYLEPNFHFDEIPYMENICLQGYWQSYKYFEDYREEIIKQLDIPYEFKKGLIGCHIRRGDYLKFPTMHPTVTIDYVYRAVEYFRELGYNNFLFFSDDLYWCYQNLNPPFGCSFKFSKDKTVIEDLSLASSCYHFIGSNSAFSFWCYWINQNENKIGVFPAKNKWFEKDLPHNVDDLYMKEWCLI